jgi:hypothetical protein
VRKGGKDAAWRVQRLIHRVRKKTHFPVARRRGEILYRRVSWALGVAEPPVAADHVVVSLTSFSLRIGKLHQVVSSLLDQSMQPSKIVLYLPLSEFPGRSVPRSLSRLEGERFEIRFVSDNLRPYNKLLPAIADFPGAWIATTDDDRLYPVNWLERLLKSAAENPGTIICAGGRRMVVKDGQFLPYGDWPTDESPRRSFLLFPVGTWGVLYPPGSLDRTMIDPGLIRKLALLNDDVWFKAMSLMQNMPCFVSGSKDSAPALSFNPDIQLWHLNQRGSLTDDALKKVFDYFGLTPDVILAKEAALNSSKRASGDLRDSVTGPEPIVDASIEPDESR